MKTFLFNWTVEPVKNDWWTTDSHGMVEIAGNNLAEAKRNFLSYMEKTYCYEFSKHARRNASKMYIDKKDGTSKQVGVIYTGKTEVEFDYKYKSRYFRLWTEIRSVTDVYFC